VALRLPATKAPIPKSVSLMAAFYSKLVKCGQLLLEHGRGLMLTQHISPQASQVQSLLTPLATQQDVYQHKGLPGLLLCLPPAGAGRCPACLVQAGGSCWEAREAAQSEEPGPGLV
jgi:hypothetical protein